MDAAVKNAVEAWLSDPSIEDADKQEIRDLQGRGDEKEPPPHFLGPFFSEQGCGKGTRLGAAPRVRHRKAKHRIHPRQ